MRYPFLEPASGVRDVCYSGRMEDANEQPSGDTPRRTATSDDTARQAATATDSDYSLSVEDASAVAIGRDLPRRPRPAKGELDAAIGALQNARSAKPARKAGQERDKRRQGNGLSY